MANNTHILPDSRLLHNPDINSQVVDWPLPGGGTVRCEAQMIYCANCGSPYGYVPKENTSFVCYLCRKCFEKHGAVTGTFAVPEDEFNRAVAEEMVALHGRHLSEIEIFQLKEKGELGRALELLEAESPYALPNPARI